HFAFGRVLDVPFLFAAPFHANGFHAEVVVRFHLKHKLFGIEHHFLPRQVFHSQGRRLVVVNVDGKFEPILSSQGAFLLPLEFTRARFVDAEFAGGDGGIFELRRLAVDLGGTERPAGSGDKRAAAAFDDRKRTTADVDFLHVRTAQIFGQRDLGTYRG